MRVSESRQVLFVHVPKTGGSTLDAMIDAEVPDARKVHGRTRHEGYGSMLEAEPALSDYWSCGFVRNPWARMVSWWAMATRFADDLENGGRKQRNKISRVPHIWTPLVRYSGTFETFVMEGTEHVPRLRLPQVAMLTAEGRQVDFVGKIESFVEDTNVLREKLGLDPVEGLPRRNPSTHGHYSEYYSDASRQRIAEVFADDVEAFGYDFERR